MSDRPVSELSPRTTIIMFVVVTLAVLAGGALLLMTRPQPARIILIPPAPTRTLPPTETPAPTPTSGPVTVYVTGAVVRPESVLTLPPGSRVSDALAAAGGTLPTANLTRVNLAGILRDGDQVHVPVQDQEVSLPTPSGGAIVNVNQATAEELALLPGIGPGLAARIVAYREANGRFADLNALDDVEGIGPALLERLKDWVTFE